MAATAQDIVDMALIDSGVIGQGQSSSAEDSQKGLLRLNWLLSQWQVKRWLVWHLKDLSIVSTGAQSYTVGPGGDIDYAWTPDKLESAFVRQLTSPNNQNIDYPLRLILSREEYSRITIKGLKSFPYAIFYDSAYPLGSIFPWPIPQASIYEVHIQVKEVLSQIPTLDTELVLPPEYFAAMYYNLAVEFMIGYKQPMDQALVAKAREALNVIRLSNTQIATLTMPTPLVRPGLYNIFSDQDY